MLIEVNALRQKWVSYQLNKNKYLLDDEFDHLVKILWDYAHKNPRDSLLLLLAIHTGARASELLQIQISHINFFDESVLIIGLKNSNDREIPLPAKVFRLLQDYLEADFSYNKSKHEELKARRLFPITYIRFYQIWEHYRPCHKKLHSLRHTFAIRLYKKTRDIRLVQFALGHRSISNTMIYADYVYSQEELRKLILWNALSARLSTNAAVYTAYAQDGNCTRSQKPKSQPRHLSSSPQQTRQKKLSLGIIQIWTKWQALH